jgi:hypothetical protein
MLRDRSESQWFNPYLLQRLGAQLKQTRASSEDPFKMLILRARSAHKINVLNSF